MTNTMTAYSKNNRTILERVYTGKSAVGKGLKVICTFLVILFIKRLLLA